MYVELYVMCEVFSFLVVFVKAKRNFSHSLQKVEIFFFKYSTYFFFFRLLFFFQNKHFCNKLFHKKRNCEAILKYQDQAFYILKTKNKNFKQSRKISCYLWNVGFFIVNLNKHNFFYNTILLIEMKTSHNHHILANVLLVFEYYFYKNLDP